MTVTPRLAPNAIVGLLAHIERHVSRLLRYLCCRPFHGEHMSIFGKIWDRITGDRNATPANAPAPTGSPRPDFGDVRSASSSAPAQPVVDVEAIMTDLERKSGHKSNWRVSIVDLM